MKYRPPAHCLICGKELEAIHADRGEHFIGDTFMGYKPCVHSEINPIPATPKENNAMAEELKRRLAKEGSVSELDTRDAYAVEWTVAAMSESKAKGIEGKNWRQQFKEDFYRDNNILTAKDLDKAWAIAERHALMAYKYIYNHIKPDKSNEAKKEV